MPDFSMRDVALPVAAAATIAAGVAAALAASKDRRVQNAGDCQVGVVGLGVMGSQLLLNLAEKLEATVAGVDMDVAKVSAAAESAKAQPGQLSVRTFSKVREFVDALQRPRVVLLLVPAGRPIDAACADLTKLLVRGDLVVDMGNEWFENTERRQAAFAQRGIHFMGCGISGGERGARIGPCLMPGGPREGYELLRPVFEKIAAKVKVEEGSPHEEPCVCYIGKGGSGHYVKMVHNGIEYGDMQLIAEASHVCRCFNLTADQVSDFFASCSDETCNDGLLGSYLVEITASLFRKKDDKMPSRALVDMIMDSAGSKGTGSWTVQQAAKLGVPCATIAAALEARYVSSLKSQRVQMNNLIAEMGATASNGHVDSVGAPPHGWEEALKDALLASKLCSYAQGMALILAASEEYGWELNPADLARIWRGGCIIRARVLSLVAAAYERDASLPNLLLDPHVAAVLDKCTAGWRAAVAMAAQRGVPMPACAASLGYYDSFRRGVLRSAQCVQAQRDFFGGHGFKRIDAEGTFTARWEE